MQYIKRPVENAHMDINYFNSNDFKFLFLNVGRKYAEFF